MDYIGVSEVSRSVFLLLICFIASVRSDYSSLHFSTLLHVAGCEFSRGNLALVDARFSYNSRMVLQQKHMFLQLSSTFINHASHSFQTFIPRHGFSHLVQNCIYSSDVETIPQSRIEIVGLECVLSWYLLVLRLPFSSYPNHWKFSLAFNLD